LGGDELPNRSSAPEDRIAVGNRLLSLENVSVWLADGFVILADINWQVRSGEHWAVLGPNGAG
jgi:ABC-type molybdenum transport system ATPase subunit/photorepair protein PhrA